MSRIDGAADGRINATPHAPVKASKELVCRLRTPAKPTRSSGWENESVAGGPSTVTATRSWAKQACPASRLVQTPVKLVTIVWMCVEQSICACVPAGINSPTIRTGRMTSFFMRFPGSASVHSDLIGEQSILAAEDCAACGMPVTRRSYVNVPGLTA